MAGLHSGEVSAFIPHSSARFKFFSLRAAVVAERYSIQVDAQLVNNNKIKIDNKIDSLFIIIK